MFDINFEFDYIKLNTYFQTQEGLLFFTRKKLNV